MPKTYEELVAECFCAYVNQPKGGASTASWLQGENIVPLFKSIADGLVEAEKRQQDYYKARDGELK